MSCDPRFRPVERLIQQLYFKYKETVAKFILREMSGIYIPGRDVDDIAEDVWIAFGKSVSRDAYSKLALREGDTLKDSERRLCCLLFTITRRRIAEEMRQSYKPSVKNQINVDFTSEYQSDAVTDEILDENYPGKPDTAEEIRRAIADLRVSIATEKKQPWRVLNLILVITSEYQPSSLTDEELRAEVSHRIGRKISVDQIRYARRLLVEKAHRTPELRHLVRHYYEGTN